jgi:hypothetical protein
MMHANAPVSSVNLIFFDFFARCRDSDGKAAAGHMKMDKTDNKG